MFNAPVGVPRATDPPSGLRPFFLSPRTYLVILLIVVPAGGFMVWAELYPSIHANWCIESYIPSFEKRLGFKYAPIALPDGAGLRPGLVEVTPGGPLSRAGFRPGDIPVAYHGGVAELCGALEGADEGYGRIDVVNIADWNSDGPNRRRQLRIPSAK